jgi:hypothetical protein
MMLRPNKLPVPDAGGIAVAGIVVAPMGVQINYLIPGEGVGMAGIVV